MESPLSQFRFAQFQFFIKPTGSINLAAYRYVDWQTQGRTLQHMSRERKDRSCISSFPTLQGGWVGRREQDSHLSFTGFMMTTIAESDHARLGSILEGES